MEAEEARENIVSISGELSSLGLVHGSWGNVSLRVDRQSFAVTPSGVEYRFLKPREVSIVGLDLSRKGGGKPSLESPLHAEVYRQGKARAVVHTHPAFASSFALARKSLPPVLEEVAQAVGGEVKCAPYAPPGSRELAEEAVRALGDRSAAFLSHHGLVAVGETLEEALKVSLVVEKACKSYLFATLLGEVEPLPEGEVGELRRLYLGGGDG